KIRRVAVHGGGVVRSTHTSTDIGPETTTAITVFSQREIIVDVGEGEAGAEVEVIGSVAQTVIREIVERTVDAEARSRLVAEAGADRVAIAAAGRRIDRAIRLHVLAGPLEVPRCRTAEIEAALEAVIDLGNIDIGVLDRKSTRLNSSHVKIS